MRYVLRVLCVVVAFAVVAGCGTIRYRKSEVGIISGHVLTIWVGNDRFVYVPAPKGAPFYFTTANSGKRISPGLMYTDGGSIPTFLRGFKGFSPWGFGPAYVIHDWIFYGRHCIVDGKDDRRFDDIRGFSFDDSAWVLAEAIKTLVDTGQVREQVFVSDVISNAVDSTVARTLWEQTDACEPVSPWHIAVAWKAVLGPDAPRPPDSWKLSEAEIAAARKLIKYVPAKLISAGAEGPAQ